MQNKMNTIFNKIFDNNNNTRLFFAPGRVNLIGEHIDYNGGYVLPCSLEIGTYAMVRKRTDNKIRFYSENYSKFGVVDIDLDRVIYDLKDDWVNYPKGVISIFVKDGYLINAGFDIAYFGNIPNGAGLSSSASIELVTAVMLNELYNFNIETTKLVSMCQQSENEFIGVNCGIMDQFAIGMGKKDKAILINTATLEFKYVDLLLKEYTIVIVNTNKRRGLADSKYNERHKECNIALEKFKSIKNIDNLCELTVKEFEANKEILEDEVLIKRAKHVIYENERTINAYKFLEKGEIVKFASLLNDSHKSLKNDFEVTGIELDTLVEISQKFSGVIGSRMTGAGFGGCTISIIEEDKISDFINVVGKKYKDKIGYNADFYVVKTGNGAGEIY